MGSIIENRILFGIAFITGTIIIIGWLVINENARMEEFTDRAEGRKIEQGARLFENNCASCHGFEGLGIAGVAPALNNPHFFGYNFLADIQTEIDGVKTQLSTETDPDARAELDAQLGALEAEQTLRVETIVYDWSDKVGSFNPEVDCADIDANPDEVKGYSEKQLCEMGELGVQLTALDEEIVQLDGVTSGALLGVYINQRETQELAPLVAERDDLTTKQAAAEAEEGPALTAEESERLAAVEEEIIALEAELQPYKTLADERNRLDAERRRFQTVVDAHAEVVSIREQLAQVESDLAALGEAPEEGGDPNAAERETLTTQAQELTTALETAMDTRQTGYDDLVAEGNILAYNPSAAYDATGALSDAGVYSRLQQVSWGGTLYSFVEGTLIGGRPPSKAYWPNPMPNWSNVTGGPLRPDQIRSLTEFILNWDRDFTLEDLRDVRQFARVPGGGVGDGDPLPSSDPVEIQAAVAELVESGDLEPTADAGQELFGPNGYGCAGCHGAQAGTGPALTGLWDRAVSNEGDRLITEGFEDNPEAYVIESIVNPGAYVVESFADGVMPATFGQRMSVQDMANILEYIKSQ